MLGMLYVVSDLDGRDPVCPFNGTMLASFLFDWQHMVGSWSCMAQAPNLSVNGKTQKQKGAST